MTHSLKPRNTFGIDHCAKHIVCAENEQQLLSARQQATREGLPVMIRVKEATSCFWKITPAP